MCLWILREHPFKKHETHKKRTDLLKNCLELKRQLSFPDSSSSELYKAVYQDTDCGALLFENLGLTAPISYDQTAIKSVRGYCKRGYKLAVRTDEKENLGVPFIVLRKNKKEIRLHRLLYAKYNGLPLTEELPPIHIRDVSGYAEGILDLRRENLYASRDELSNRPEIVQCPWDENDKYIHIIFDKDRRDIDEWVEYTPELLSIFMEQQNVRLDCPIGTDRGSIVIHGHRYNIARFVCLFKKHFSDTIYQSQKDPIAAFLDDYERLSRAEKGKVAAHINSFKQENTFDNLLLMDEKTNGLMSNYIKWLPVGFEVYTAVDEDDRIRIELTTPFTKEPVNLIFETPEAYCHFQRTILGKNDLGRNLQMVHCITRDEREGFILTLAGMVASKLVTSKTAKEKPFHFWKDRTYKRNLLALPEGAFFMWPYSDSNPPRLSFSEECKPELGETTCFQLGIVQISVWLEASAK